MLLSDSFARKLSYLRLSVTDVCNFRCTYCLPNGYTRNRDMEAPLSVSEIRNLVDAFAELGFTKVRLTGGEPTVRKDFLQLVAAVRSVPRIKTVALSTNGFRLRELLPHLRPSGVDSLSVSVDTLDPRRFAALTGHSILHRLIEDIEAAARLDFNAVKVNCVLLAETSDEELQGLIDWACSRPITLRFIELMEVGENRRTFTVNHRSAVDLETRLINDEWKLLKRMEDSGPAREYYHERLPGRIGFITPYSKTFCHSCNRLRVTSRGDLQLCLFAEEKWPLRDLLRSPGQKEELIMRVSKLVSQKQESHHLQKSQFGRTSSFSIIGG
jgi:GTP 3',8-cyclase